MNHTNKIQQHLCLQLPKIIASVMILCSISCATKKQILYLQDIDTYNNTKVVAPQNTIQHNDILSVVVSSSIIETAEPYNKTSAFLGAQVWAKTKTIKTRGIWYLKI